MYCPLCGHPGKEPLVACPGCGQELCHNCMGESGLCPDCAYLAAVFRPMVLAGLIHIVPRLAGGRPGTPVAWAVPFWL